jgi:hypothetical protein
MISDLATLIRDQEFTGLKGIYVRRADMTSPKPYAVVSRFGGDRNADLSGNDASLLFTDVQVEVYSSKPNTDIAIAELIVVFLEQSIGVTMGTRTLFGCTVDEPEDFDNAPLDGSDDWNGGTKFIVHCEHN